LLRYLLGRLLGGSNHLLGLLLLGLNKIDNDDPLRILLEERGEEEEDVEGQHEGVAVLEALALLEEVNELLEEGAHLETGHLVRPLQLHLHHLQGLLQEGLHVAQLKVALVVRSVLTRQLIDLPLEVLQLALEDLDLLLLCHFS